jgi:DNA-binding response OmpR family regulator
MKEDRAKSLASGANDYVTKTVDTDLLLRLINTYLYAPSEAGTSEVTGQP